MHMPVLLQRLERGFRGMLDSTRSFPNRTARSFIVGTIHKDLALHSTCSTCWSCTSRGSAACAHSRRSMGFLAWCFDRRAVECVASSTRLEFSATDSRRSTPRRDAAPCRCCLASSQAGDKCSWPRSSCSTCPARFRRPRSRRL
ncbi:hypothetical protein H310_14735 [Aphanomyces invadans]|uniref:Uncharacterized protein n=1 Tax=Aphanomyces invadans TaxID=157072 RepID=A0A024T8N6_9STRA|nr:hypothetical protein H310_14735 [Aphanomyces invadans]ETV90495.1 hypothetical protein H310_14735 [Aphanomyces invadans]|eukprot:XP_008880883.1 hypothetical protein H310_14735 [Aphanomyces invadans]